MPVRISPRITDKDHSRPVAQALRELAQQSNLSESQLSALATAVARLEQRQLTVQQINQALSTTGSAPLNPPTTPGGSTGGSGTILYGVHLARTGMETSADLDGTLYWETDRTLLYVYVASEGWRYVTGVMRRTLLGDDTDDAAASVPSDDPTDGGDTQDGVNDATVDGHPPVTGLTAYNSGLIIGGTALEYPALVAATSTQAERDANQLQLLLRVIWHLNTFGFTAGRQRNPSGVLSTDKIAVVQDGVTRAFDIFTGVYTGTMTVQAIQVSPANLVPDSGTAD